MRDRSRVASRVPYFAVSSARTVLRGRRDPRLPPLPIGPICPQSPGDTRPSPSVLQESAARRRRSPLERRPLSCFEDGGERSREDVLRCVRPRIDRLPRLGVYALSPDANEHDGNIDPWPRRGASSRFRTSRKPR